MEYESIKLIKVVKNLEIGMTTIVNFLTSKGFKIEKNPMTRLTPEMYQALLKEFKEVKGQSSATRGNISVNKLNKSDSASSNGPTIVKKIILPTPTNHDLTDQEILERLYKFWGINRLEFVGKLTINEVGAFFNDVFLNKKRLSFPEKKGCASVFLPASKAKNLEADTYYSFHAILSDKKIRESKKNCYALTVDTTRDIKRIESAADELRRNELFVKKIFSERGRYPQDASTIARQLSLNELELYTQTERFIFELIQNADDMPNCKYNGVSAEFVLTDDFLVFMHNGLPFESENVEAICDAGKSTKMLDIDKTGYKGIGFKSVFSDSKAVFIHSNAFSFRFDKQHEIYSTDNFYKLYAKHFDAFPQEKEDFIGKESEFADLKNIPWQIKPIWTTRTEYPSQLKRNIPEVFQKEVTISLQIGSDVIASKDNKGYKKIIANLFSEPRFLLFLRNVSAVSFRANNLSISIDVSRNGFFKEINVSGSERQQSLSYVSHNGDLFEIEINNKKFAEANLQLEISNNNSKTYFRDKSGIVVKDIPEKLASLKKTTISFAAQIDGKRIVKLDKADSILFNYLPTSDKRFEFPFLVNADFITTTNRETIIADNKWNIYLFYNIGYYSIAWISDIATKRSKDTKHSVRLHELQTSVLNLLPKRFNLAGDIYDKFNHGRENALKELPFIPSQYGNRLLKVNECLLDNTDIFENEFYSSFFKLLYPEHELVKYSLLNKTKLTNEEDYGFSIATFEKEDIQKLYCLSSFSPANNPTESIDFIKFLKSKGHIEILKKFKSILNHKGEITEPENLICDIQTNDKLAINFDETLEFLHPLLEEQSRIDLDFNSIISIDLGVDRFNAVKYIESLSTKSLSVNLKIRDKETNLRFWQFIFRYREQLPPDTKKKFQDFIVWTTDQKLISLGSCFLSSEFDTIYDIEAVASKLAITDMFFVNSHFFSSNKERDDWRSFFYDCEVKKSEGFNLYFHKVKPLIKSDGITADNHLTITRFIFDVYSNNIAKFTQEEISALGSLKLMTLQNGLQKANVCIFANPLFHHLLPEHQVDNQVDVQPYIAESKDIRNWKEFFLKLQVAELDDIEILKKKINIMLTTSNSITVQNVVSVWRTLFNYQDQLLNDNSYKAKIKGLPVLLTNGNLSYINNPVQPIYFSTKYSPKTSIEELLYGYYDYFLSAQFPESESDYELWRKFFLELGVNDKITTTGSGSSFMITHLSNLSNYDFALRFWNYFQNNFKVSEIIPNSTLGNYLRQNTTIPCFDKKTMQRPGSVYAKNLIDRVGDESKVSAFEFEDDVAAFLGIISSINETELEANHPILKYYGNLGEKYVYNYLLNEYKNKGVFQETNTGFVIKNETFNIEVVWNNKQLILANIYTLEDSCLPYDIRVNENGNERFIEVKSTYEKSVFYMPISEWDFMIENQNRYYIYRVINVTDTPRINNQFLAVSAFLEGNIKPQIFPANILITN